MIRTSLRQYGYGAGFGRSGMATYGGAWSGTSNFQDTREDPTKAHPYFDWLQRTGKAYGQDSYGEWSNSLPPGSAVPPSPPPQGVFPNDPSSPSYQAPGRGGGPTSIATAARPATTQPKMPVTGSKYVSASADGTQFIWELPDGTQRAFGADGLPLEGTWNPSQYANASKAAPTAGAGAGASAGTGGVGRTVTGHMANGSTVTGTVTAEENGQTTVRWGDGTVTTYDSSGALVSSTPGGGGAAAGTGAPAPTSGTVAPTQTPTPTGTPAPAGAATPAASPTATPAPIGGTIGPVVPTNSPVEGAPPDSALWPATTPPPSGPISWAPGYGPGGAIAPAGSATLDAGLTTPPPDVSAAIGTLGATPPPNTNFTIPPQFAIQLPPPIDESGGGAGGALISAT